VPVHRPITSLEVAALNALVPLPLAMPVNVATPLPPLATGKMLDTLLERLISEHEPSPRKKCERSHVPENFPVIPLEVSVPRVYVAICEVVTCAVAAL